MSIFQKRKGGLCNGILFRSIAYYILFSSVVTFVAHRKEYYYLTSLYLFSSKGACFRCSFLLYAGIPSSQTIFDVLLDATNHLID